MIAPNAVPCFDEADLMASISRESFFAFVQEFWGSIIDEAPVWNWHIEFLCNELQIVAERVFAGQPKEYDLIINIPPGTTKSTICSVMFPAWCWTRMPSTRCICASYAYSLAMDLSRKSRDVVQGVSMGDEANTRPGYSICFPDVELRDDQNTKGYFANTAKGVRYAVGIGGSVMGMHGHFLIIDDPLDPAEAVSEAERKRCNQWMTETIATRKIDKAVTPTILIQQRLHEDDPSGARLALKDAPPVRHICLPAEVEDGPKPSYLAKRYVNGLLDPVRMPHSVLRESEKTLGTYAYCGQFRQRPVPRGGGMFTVDRFHYGKFPRTPKSWKRLIRYWDKAGSAGTGAYTVGLLMGEEVNGRLWVMDVVRGQWESGDREVHILRAAQRDASMFGKLAVKQYCEQEPGSGGKDSARDFVRRLRGFRVGVDRPTGDKVQRADPFAGQVNEGLVYVEEAEWTAAYVSELQFFPFAKYKDQVDASSGAHSMITSVRRVGAR